MKTIKLNKLVALFVGVLALYGCVQDDDFKAPDTVVVDPSIPGNIIDIDAVLGTYNQSGEDIITFDGTNNYMLGYVISSDEGGNFFEELIMQDRPENPTAGINIQVDVSPLFTVYNFGRKVYVKLDGLSAGISNGVITLGKRDGNNLAKISAALMTEHLIRTPEVATIVPLEVNISDFSDELESLYIRLNDVQFNRFDVLGDNPKTFAAEDDDQFDGERILESCGSNSTVIVSTSTFSDFKSLLLPNKRGSIDGILTRDFFDDFYTIYINTPEALNFNDDTRCDPIETSCGIATTIGTTNLFMDSFETQPLNNLITANGWTNFIEAGTEGWEAYTATGSNASLGRSARVGSFGSNDASSVAWLITPAIDLDGNEGETLRFKTSNSFSDGSTMQVLFSNDWDGTPGGIITATWGIVSDAFIVQDSDPFGPFFPSGNVDISCLEGTGYFAFKYQGSGQTSNDGTYELDDVSIDAQ